MLVHKYLVVSFQKEMAQAIIINTAINMDELEKKRDCTIIREELSFWKVISL